MAVDKFRRNIELLRNARVTVRKSSVLGESCGNKVRPLFEEAARAQYGEDPDLAGRTLRAAQAALGECLGLGPDSDVERWFSFFGLWWAARLLEKGEVNSAIDILQDLEESFGPHARELGILEDYGKEVTEQMHSRIVQSLEVAMKGELQAAANLADSAANLQYKLAVEKTGIETPEPESWKSEPPIEERIAPLVKIMNEKGYRTVSSCEGHWSRVGKWGIAHVVFYSSEEQFRRLNEVLSNLVRSGKVSLYRTPRIKGCYGTPDIIGLSSLNILPDTRGPYFYMRRETDSVITEIVKLLTSRHT